MFFGSFAHTLDEKGRLMIPRKMREELGYKVYIMQGFDGSLSVYTEGKFLLLSEEFAKLPFNQRKNRDYLRAQFATTYEMEVDKLGRVQIPTALLKKFNISRNVTVLGMGDHIEIWDSAKYEAYEQEAIENFDKNAEEL
jgi:MraZ protein